MTCPQITGITTDESCPRSPDIRMIPSRSTVGPFGTPVIGRELARSVGCVGCNGFGVDLHVAAERRVRRPCTSQNRAAGRPSDRSLGEGRRLLVESLGCQNVTCRATRHLEGFACFPGAVASHGGSSRVCLFRPCGDGSTRSTQQRGSQRGRESLQPPRPVAPRSGRPGGSLRRHGGRGR